MTAKLTPITVANAKPRQRAGGPIRTEIHDRGCPGLFLIVQPSGAKSWALRYRVAGKSRKLTLGGVELSLMDARMAATQASGRDAVLRTDIGERKRRRPSDDYARA